MGPALGRQALVCSAAWHTAPALRPACSTSLSSAPHVPRAFSLQHLLRGEVGPMLGQSVQGLEPRGREEGTSPAGPRFVSHSENLRFCSSALGCHPGAPATRPHPGTAPQLSPGALTMLWVPPVVWPRPGPPPFLARDQSRVRGCDHQDAGWRVGPDVIFLHRAQLPGAK